MSDNQGSVAVVAAASIFALMFGAAVALDLTNLYYRKSVDQRIADQSAIAAAFTYASTGSTATAQTAAASLALANGVASAADVVTSFGPSPTGDGHTAAQVVVVTPVNLTGFGRLITSSHSLPGGDTALPVGATAWAEVHEKSPCILALTSPGITMVGGTSIAATNCSVVSDSGISLSAGPTLTATTIQAVGSITESDATINGPQYPNSSITSDPYAGTAVFSRETIVLTENEAAPSFPTMPTAPASGNYTTCTAGTLTLAPSTSYGYIVASGSCSAITFSGSGTFSAQGLTVSSGNVAINMPAGTYKIGDNKGTGIDFGGGTTTLNITGSPTIYIYGSVYGTTGATGIINGSATWYIENGIEVYGGGAKLTMSNTGSQSSSITTSDIVVGASATGVFPSASYTITGSSQYGGLVVDGLSATFGNGSFIIEDGIEVGGGSTLTIGSAVSGSSVFEVFQSTAGTSCPGTAVNAGGSSTLSIGSFNYFDVCGQWVTDGSVYLGAGAVTINGEFDLGSAGGGTFSATNNSIVASGQVVFGQGFSKIALDAPTAITSSSEGSTQTVAIASNTASASTVTQGATDSQVVGLIYLPNSPLTINGGGNLTGDGSCLQMIANSISISGGGQLTTNCSGLGTSSGSGAISLVE